MNRRFFCKSIIGAISAGVILALVIAVFPLGCGVKGPPRPPERLTPVSVNDLSLSVRGREVILKWSVPGKTTSGAPLRDLEGFKIFRGSPGKCPTCPQRLAPIANIEYRYPKGSQAATGRMLYGDRDLVPGRYIYSVRAYNKKGNESGESNLASIDLPFPASAPEGLRAIAGDKRVELGWDPVKTFETGEAITDLAGYNIYRGEEPDNYGEIPINSTPVQETHFIDLHVVNNRKYYYAVRAVRHVEGKSLEGNLSKEVSSFPQDMTPPDPPEGFHCQLAQGGVLLRWRANKEADLKGYNVYRRMKGSTIYEKLTLTPIEETQFLDKQVVIKAWYIYRVTAVDNSPGANESRYSMECQIQYRK